MWEIFGPAWAWPKETMTYEEDRIDLLRLIRKYTEGIESHREEIISILLEHHVQAEQWKEAR